MTTTPTSRPIVRIRGILTPLGWLADVPFRFVWITVALLFFVLVAPLVLVFVLLFFAFAPFDIDPMSFLGGPKTPTPPAAPAVDDAPSARMDA